MKKNPIFIIPIVLVKACLSHKSGLLSERKGHRSKKEREYLKIRLFQLSNKTLPAYSQIPILNN